MSIINQDQVLLGILSGIPFKFVDETQQKGRDYDAQIELPAGGIACCEMKSKLDATPLGNRTIENSLKKAAKQLPSSSPGIIVCK